MSSPLDNLPDLSPLGGHWTTTTGHHIDFGHIVTMGRAEIPGITWPYEPEDCPITTNTWYLDDTLLLCDGCGTDGT
ncbi:hypothetical protein [Nocardia tengchongensis]|uniref:hypothetical protein n=1 Tax=Nocardia tengchongensis TaxID=2055889 RepID=UPI0036A7F9A2